MRIFFVLPSMKPGGGVIEVLRLAEQLRAHGASVAILTLWTSPNAVATTIPVVPLSDWPPQLQRATYQLPWIGLRFFRWLAGSMRAPGAGRDAGFVFTHYSTMPLALLVPRVKRFYFVQGLEWRFIRNAAASSLLRTFMVQLYRRGRTLTTNSYLTKELIRDGVPTLAEIPIWADRAYLDADSPVRDIDFVMMPRKGATKRLDLYVQFLALAKQHGNLRLAAITPDDEIARELKPQLEYCLVRPSLQEMRSIYSRTNCFIHLSEHEGFGLPPLEAMGAGCIPICRNSGGVESYLSSAPLRSNLLPREMPIGSVFQHAVDLLRKPLLLDGLRDECRREFLAGLDRLEHREAGVSRILRCLAAPPAPARSVP